MAIMQQVCVDDVLMANYAVNNTEDLNNITSQEVDRVGRLRCEPFDCNGKGSCIDGSCMCEQGTIYVTCTGSLLHGRLMFDE